MGVVAMRPGPAARFVVRRIHRYRTKMAHSRWAGGCRFTPTCSHYAEEALQTRHFPFAMLLIAGRLLRCNPLLHRVTHDPVRRSARRRLRPNAIPTAFAVLALSGLVVVVTAGVAEAVGVSGGCKVTVRGEDPSDMTKKDPLVVHKGEVVQVDGLAPTNVPVNAGDPNNTVIRISIIEGIFKTSTTNNPGHGPHWGGGKNVDKYLKYGVGLYEVTGTGTGPNWHCDGSGYVELKDGNPLGKPIGDVALVLSILGAGGAAASARGGKPDDEPSPSRDVAPEDSDGANEFVDDVAHDRGPFGPDFAGEMVSGIGCLALIVIACLGVAGASDTNLTPFAVAGGSVARAPKRRVWVHGHPILGFISGLIGGLGLTVLLQQFAMWPLTVLTAIVFPVIVGLLCGVRAYLGRPFKRA